MKNLHFEYLHHNTQEKPFPLNRIWKQFVPTPLFWICLRNFKHVVEELRRMTQSPWLMARVSSLLLTQKESSKNLSVLRNSFRNLCTNHSSERSSIGCGGNSSLRGCGINAGRSGPFCSNAALIPVLDFSKEFLHMPSNKIAISWFPEMLFEYTLHNCRLQLQAGPSSHLSGDRHLNGVSLGARVSTYLPSVADEGVAVLCERGVVSAP
jgi:hypothetical protein